MAAAVKLMMAAVIICDTMTRGNEHLHQRR